MATPFDHYNYRFSYWAHMRAQESCYPLAFGDSTIEYIDKGGSTEDMWHGIDRIVVVDGLPFTVQERFRRATYAHYQELTVTAANKGTGEKGDFFKLKADLYAYGYIRESGAWEDFLLIDVPKLKWCFSKGLIVPNESYYRRKNQIIWGFPFSALHQHNIVLFHA